MDLGLGNLADVKSFVLPPALAVPQDTQYNAILATIASGIAGRFESYCNRKFSYAVGDQVTFDSQRKYYILPRYPVSAVTKLEMSDTQTYAWSDITTTIVQEDLSIGWIYFGCFVGDPICLVRATYTGGFFYETLEPTDSTGTPTPGYPSAVPAGSKPVPPALKQVWLFQTLHEFQAKDRLLPVGLKDTTKSRTDLRFEQMQLLPEVENTLAQFRRYLNV